MKYSVYSHSAVRVESGGKVFCFDPFEISGAPKDADAVLITHTHFDHFSPEDAAKAANENTVFVLPATCEKEVRKAFPKAKIFAMKPGETLEIPGFSAKVTAVAAYNVGKAFHPKANAWLGYVLSDAGETAYVMGDTDATPEAEAAAAKADTLFIPVGGTYTFDAEEAAAFVKRAQPKLAVPTHYGTAVGKKEDGARFRELVGGAVPVELLLG